MRNEQRVERFGIPQALSAKTVANALRSFVIVATAMLLLSLMAQSVFADRENIQIYSYSVSTPAGSSVLDKAPIYYVAGKNLDITLNTSPNATVKSVKVRGENIPLLFEESVGPPDVYYSVIKEKGEQITIRLRFRNDGRGRSDPIKINVGSRPLDLELPTASNATTASFDFVLVRVKTITRNLGNVTISLSEKELRNKFLLAVWEKFGDDGEFPFETLDEDGEPETKTLYSPFYNEWVIQIENDGIHFRWGFHVSVEDACNPTITVTGVFNIRTNKAVEWSAEPEVIGNFSPQFPLNCVGHSVPQKDKDSIREMIKNEIQREADRMFERVDEAQPGASAFINSIETRLNELRVTAVRPGDSVTIEVPYHGLSSNTPEDKGFALGAGDEIMLLANGTTGLGIGPNGIFNAKANPPIGDPSLADYGLNDEGLRFFQELAKAYREPALLPMPQENVGALVVRRSSYSPWQVVGASPRYESNYQFLGAIASVSTSGNRKATTQPPPGTFTGPTPESSHREWLNFGMNDYPETTLPSSYDSGTFTVAIVWL